ncbi:MAG TPA: hypothetical protein DD435_07285 [Cyanobacteria bacterium UBA8530]|nr:hypothetical protein [Cyanobacteria bacterium UBA8530]
MLGKIAFVSFEEAFALTRSKNFLFLALTLALVSCKTPVASLSVTSTPLKVGALLSLTGSWSNLGKTSKAALEIGKEAIEREAGAPKISLLIRDTKLSPELALEELKGLDAQGVKIVVGPQSSAELKALKPYADSHGILLVSQSSTAGSLALPNDNVLRFCPSDAPESEANAVLMKADGLTAVVPVWRADEGNDSLQAVHKAALERQGITMLNGVRYSAEAHDFSADVSSLSAAVQAAKATYGNSVGIYCASFDEAASLFDKASDDVVLKSVTWYGSNGFAKSDALPANAKAADFAVKVGFTAPIFGLDEALKGRWQPLSDQIVQSTGIVPDAFALASYDAIQVAAGAYRVVGNGAFAQWKSAFLEKAQSHSGVTGSTALNDAGDRQVNAFDFWAVRLDNGTYRWVPAGSFQGGVLKR